MDAPRELSSLSPTSRTQSAPLTPLTMPSPSPFTSLPIASPSLPSAPGARSMPRSFTMAASRAAQLCSDSRPSKHACSGARVRSRSWREAICTKE
jgi:hypothetical protein